MGAATDTRGALLLIAGMATFGSGTPISKIVTDAFPVFLASGLRMGLAAGILFAVVLAGSHAAGRPWDLDRRSWLIVGAIALIGMFGFSVLMLLGMREISGAIGGVIMATTPAVTAGGSVLFLRDRFDRTKALAIGLAVGGVLAVNVGGAATADVEGSIVLGSLLIFGAVCGEAAYTLLGKRVTADVTPITVGFLAAAIATLLFAPVAVADATGFDWSSPDGGEWAALAWWGAGTMGLGSVLWYSGVQRVSGTTASVFMGVMPVSAVALSYVLLDESPEVVHFVGLAFVLAAIAVIARSGD